MELTESQSRAVTHIHEAIGRGERLLSLSGPAGSGKTTIINDLLDGLVDVEVCTPTNKAAQVLNSKDIDAATFFKRFYLLEEKKQRGVKPKFISCKKYLENIALQRGGHYLDYGHLLPEGKRAFASKIVVDEASMVTTRMAMEMLKMTDNLILVGDRHQLPPVGDQDNPAGFFCTRRHTAELTEVLRQAEGSMILQLATELRNDTPKVKRALAYFEPQTSFESWVHDGAKMITYTNKERARVNRVVRSILGYQKPIPMEGDIMIVTNNYSDDLINGTEVVVKAFEWDEISPTALITVQLDQATLTHRMDMWAFIEDQVQGQQQQLTARGVRDKNETEREEEYLELTFGYCLTAHKAQGSEWPSVVVFDQRGLIRKIAASNDRSGMKPDEVVRRWTYTAVTRAKHQLAVAPTWWAQISNREDL